MVGMHPSMPDMLDGYAILEMNWGEIKEMNLNKINVI